MSVEGLSYDALVERNTRHGTLAVYWFMKVALLKAQAFSFHKWYRFSLARKPNGEQLVVRPPLNVDNKAVETEESDEDLMSEEMEAQRKHAASFMRRRKAVSNAGAASNINSTSIETIDVATPVNTVVTYDADVPDMTAFPAPPTVQVSDAAPDTKQTVAIGIAEATDEAFVSNVVEEAMNDGKRNLLLSLASDIISGVGTNSASFEMLNALPSSGGDIDTSKLYDEILSPLVRDMSAVPQHKPLGLPMDRSFDSSSIVATSSSSNLNVVERGRQTREMERASGQRVRQRSHVPTAPSRNGEIPSTVEEYAASVTQNHHLEHLMVQHKQRSQVLSPHVIDAPRRKSPKKDGHPTTGRDVEHSEHYEKTMARNQALQSQHPEHNPHFAFDTSTTASYGNNWDNSPERRKDSSSSYQPVLVSKRFPNVPSYGYGNASRTASVPRKSASPERAVGKSNYLHPTSSSMRQALDVKNMLHSLSSPLRRTGSGDSPRRADQQGYSDIHLKARRSTPISPNGSPNKAGQQGYSDIHLEARRSTPISPNGSPNKADQQGYSDIHLEARRSTGGLVMSSEFEDRVDTSRTAELYGNISAIKDELGQVEDQLINNSRQRDFQKRNQRILSLSTAPVSTLAGENLPLPIAPLGEYYHNQDRISTQPREQQYLSQQRHQPVDNFREGSNVNSSIDQSRRYSPSHIDHSDPPNRNPHHRNSSLYVDTSHVHYHQHDRHAPMTDRPHGNRLISPPVHPHTQRSHNQHHHRNNNSNNSNRFVKKKPGSARAGNNFKSPGRPMERAQWALLYGAI